MDPDSDPYQQVTDPEHSLTIKYASPLSEYRIGLYSSSPIKNKKRDLMFVNNFILKTKFVTKNAFCEKDLNEKSV